MKKEHYIKTVFFNFKNIDLLLLTLGPLVILLILSFFNSPLGIDGGKVLAGAGGGVEGVAGRSTTEPNCSRNYHKSNYTETKSVFLFSKK